MQEVWAAIKVGGGTTAAMLAAAGIEGQSISIPVAAAVMVFVGSLMWYLSAKFQRVDDRLQNIERALKNCPRNKNGVCETKE